jgi:C1A family cysteine protease
MQKQNGLWIGLLLGSLLGALFSTAAFADSQTGININEVQGWIARKHAKWHAQDNWVARLSREKLQRMFGLQRPPTGRLSFEGIRSAGSKDLPAALDWRSIDAIDWLGPVMNQGNCGSCVAFATIATLEAQTSISAGLPWLHPSFSPQAIFSCGGGSCDGGWDPDSAASFLQSNGVPDESCMPYTSGSTGVDVSCNAMCSDGDQRSMKIASYSQPSQSSSDGSVDQVKAALQNGPLVTTLNVYADFVTYKDGVYLHAGGDVLGGHAVSLVGYDDTQRAWLIRNSWGPQWGEQGFAWISWDDDSGVGAETWGFGIAKPQQDISIASPSEREYVSGQYSIIGQLQGVQGQQITVHVTDTTGQEVSSLACVAQTDGGTCSALLDSTQMKEGRYQVYAEAPGTTVRSQVRQFFVINSEPQMSLTLAPIQGLDLTAPLNGRPEFDIHSTSSPVPLQNLTFRAIDGNGNVIILSENDYILDQMRMGWRTAIIPNGTYTILLHGEIPYNGKTYSVDSNAFAVTVQN